MAFLVKRTFSGPSHEVRAIQLPELIERYTTPNQHGLRKCYYGRKIPSHDPDLHKRPEDWYDSAHHVVPQEDESDNQDQQDATNSGARQQDPTMSPLSGKPDYGPYINESAFRIAEWFWAQGDIKTEKDLGHLFSIILSDSFSLDQLREVAFKKANKHLGSNKQDLNKQDGDWIEDDGWREAPITLKVPFHKTTRAKGTIDFDVGMLNYRSIIEVVKEKLSNVEDMRLFHYEPYKLFWKPSPDHPETRVYSDILHSDAFIEAHHEIQQPSKNLGCQLPRVVVGLMFWSDAATLSTFGTSKVWPVYMAFANKSKYQRGKPTENLFEQVAFLESWSILLDSDLQDAIENGIVITCLDGKQRRFYIHIFTYSADYPEKMLIAGIRRGDHCCPRCLISKKEFHNMGSCRDKQMRAELPRIYDGKVHNAVADARRRIFKERVAPYGSAVGKMLEDMCCLTPAQNAFGNKLVTTGFDIYSTLVVDLMHEFELGVWKSLFVHLNQILEAKSTSSNLVHELNRRYAAHDWENVLQLLFLCCKWHALAKLRLHTNETLQLLESTTTALGNQFHLFLNETCSRFDTFELPQEAEARPRQRKSGPKRQMNGTQARPLKPPSSAITLEEIDLLGVRIIRPHLNQPGLICASSSLHQSPMDVDNQLSPTIGQPFNIMDANANRTGAASNSNVTCEVSGLQLQPEPTILDTSTLVKGPDLSVVEDKDVNWEDVEVKQSGMQRQAKKFNLSTYKFHSLGDYVRSIRRFGTTDVTTTEQLARSERRKARLVRLHQKLTNAQKKELEVQRKASRNPEPGYFIGTSENDFRPLSDFAVNGKNKADILCQHFIFDMKVHLHSRIPMSLVEYLDQNYLDYDLPTDFALPEDWSSVKLAGDQLYTHKTMRIKYQTYDMRVDEDLLHLNTDNCNIMVLNPKYKHGARPAQHPFHYGRVVGIFHTTIETGTFLKGLPPPGENKPDQPLTTRISEKKKKSCGPTPFQIPFCWVRWYKHCALQSEFHLDRVKYEPLSSEQSMGFIDPGTVLRACHIIPRISLGMANLTGSGLSELAQNEQDWNSYYVNRYGFFALDRSLFDSRYEWGLAPGHSYTRRTGSCSPCETVGPSNPEVVVLVDNHILEDGDSDDDMDSDSSSQCSYMQVDEDEMVLYGFG
ncbi:hypothetical protein FA15DRAFT_606458 [Coprinopsis marcescibilis]|uniref:Uncharacterized protein n=1 Tax=Coprinopsis marcescibilis TaxID=230819 RepID=A0A5C3KAW2_COPMA|nr:hypothetical protein FA15DRAFT_606458 [Coprinopsis marcescibilis]